jgi:hypothetical protein
MVIIYIFPKELKYLKKLTGYPYFVKNYHLSCRYKTNVQLNDISEILITETATVFCSLYIKDQSIRGHRGRDGMVVGFITTCAISAYHH